MPMRRLLTTLKTVSDTIGSYVIPAPVKERSINQSHQSGSSRGIGSRPAVIDVDGVPNTQISRWQSTMWTAIYVTIAHQISKPYV